MTTTVKKSLTPSAQCRALITCALEQEPGNVSKVARRTRLAISTTSRWLERLYDEGSTHIVGWERVGGMYSATFAIGPGQDVPTPPGIPDRWIERLSAKPVVIRRDPLVACLFGPP